MRIEYLTHSLGVHPDFIPNFQPGTRWLPGSGNALYKTFEETGITAVGENNTPFYSIFGFQLRKRRILEGFCRYSMMDATDSKDFRVRIWFRHNLVKKSSTYIIHNLPDAIKHELLELLKSRAASGEYRPHHSMATDYLVAKLVSASWESRIEKAFAKLLDYVHFLSISPY
jgi:hypothetical protein